MSANFLKTAGLVLLASIGSMGVLFKIQHWPYYTVLMAVGFFGFPVLYGYISWPVGKTFPDAKWLGTIAIMLLFAWMLVFK